MQTIKIAKSKVKALSRVMMPKGTGGTPPNGREGSMCVMECVAWVAGLPLSDRPACASTVLTSLAVRINDGSWWGSDKERTEALRGLVVGLAGSRDDAREQERKDKIWLWAYSVPVPHAGDSAVRALTAASEMWRAKDAGRADKLAAHAAKIAAAVAVVRANPCRETVLMMQAAAYDDAADAAADAAAADDAAAYADDARKATNREMRDSLVALLASML